MAKNLRIGIAGLGRLGKRHAEALAFRTRHCELVAACSPVQQERDYASAQLGVARVYEDFDRFIADPEIDAVVLVTPTSLHADQSIAALQAGKHVFVE
ncbi:MAG: Gfo/Idh/MocA family oxidoreductase, partial [Polaromonas sp.]|nr:Gfo/Idh/MocA family oxidoreductase [Polaromonas sp.]